MAPAARPDASWATSQIAAVMTTYGLLLICNWTRISQTGAAGLQFALPPVPL